LLIPKVAELRSAGQMRTSAPTWFVGIVFYLAGGGML
jgi:hypothetical protein